MASINIQIASIPYLCQTIARLPTVALAHSQCRFSAPCPIADAMLWDVLSGSKPEIVDDEGFTPHPNKHYPCPAFPGRSGPLPRNCPLPHTESSLPSFFAYFHDPHTPLRPSLRRLLYIFVAILNQLLTLASPEAIMPSSCLLLVP